MAYGNMHWVDSKTKTSYVMRDKIFKTGEFYFDLESFQATSFSWWNFVTLVPKTKTIYFNEYYYSNCTGNHQKRMENILFRLLKIQDHGFKIRRVSVSNGLNHIDREILKFTSEIKSLEEKIATPRTHKAKNAERAALVLDYKNKIEKLKILDLELAEQGNLDAETLAKLHLVAVAAQKKINQKKKIQNYKRSIAKVIARLGGNPDLVSIPIPENLTKEAVA